MYCQFPEMSEKRRTYTGTPVGMPETVAERFVP